MIRSLLPSKCHALNTLRCKRAINTKAHSTAIASSCTSSKRRLSGSRTTKDLLRTTFCPPGDPQGLAFIVWRYLAPLPFLAVHARVPQAKDATRIRARNARRVLPRVPRRQVVLDLVSRCLCVKSHITTSTLCFANRAHDTMSKIRATPVSICRSRVCCACARR